ncbi:MAG: topoisomerase IV, partial [Proteobacteria bacterium]|nr:topoisomerase IV [Pseudomonadota bacterium]
MKETLGLDSVDNISLDNKVLNEIKDSNLLDRFVEIFPNLYQAITNTALAKGGIYQAILPAGAKLARSLKMEGAFRGMYHG